MADTQTLLALIDEFPQPFLDPEATPAPEPVVEEVVDEMGTGIVRFQAYTGSEDLEEGEIVDLLLKDGTVQVWFRHYKNSITGEHSFYRYDYPENGGYISIDLIKGILIRKIEQEAIRRQEQAEEAVERETEECFRLSDSLCTTSTLTGQVFDKKWREKCQKLLTAIKGQAELEQMTFKFLENMAELARFCHKLTTIPPGTQQPLPSVWDDTLVEFELPNLPETHARQGSGDCPSGMCPIDH